MWITIAQFFLSLSILVVLHELGHFAPAKWFKTRVEKFYLFFNPGFSLYKVQKGETEYGIGWLPLGGYVKISGMIDESMDTDQMKGPPQPWEFRSKPAWQRLIIMIGGVTVNFILGIFLFGMVFWVWGEEYLPNDQLKDGIGVTQLGLEMGLRDGDKIVSIGDKLFTKYNPGFFNKEIVINGADNAKVIRNGKEVVVPIDSNYAEYFSKYENKGEKAFALKMPAVVSSINSSSKADAASAGIKVGDEIIGFNGITTMYFHVLVDSVLSQTKQEANSTFKIKRGADTLDISYLTLFPKKKGLLRRLLGKDAEMQRRIGFEMHGPNKYYTREIEHFNFVPAFSKGWSESIGFLGDQIKAFGQMIRGKIKAKDSLGSFITIGQLFGPTWDWKNFWRMTAMLSILLGFFNLLPIPALDGGYVMFLLFESITGIKVSDAVMEKTTMIGFFVLMGLMLYALSLDIMRQF